MDRDLELWKAWQAQKNDVNLTALLQQLNPLIQAEVNRRAGSLAREMLETQAKILAVRAIQGFDPSRGVKLSTHIINQLQKLSRVNYAHQNAARIPEHSMLKFHTVNMATEDLREELGRDPTTEELADELGWSPKKLEDFHQKFGRPELAESGDTPTGMFVSVSHNPQLGYAYSVMSPRQQKIFEYSTGYNGAPRLNTLQILSKLNITQGVLSYEKVKIKEILRKVAV